MAETIADGASQRAPNAQKIRRHPFVTYVLVLVLVGSSGWILQRSPQAVEEAAGNPAVLAARSFFEHNPQVELSGQLAGMFGTELVAKVRAEYRSKLEAGRVPVLSERIQAKTQERFQRLQREIFASLHDLPTYRFGVTKSGTPASNYVAHVAVHETLRSLVFSLVFLTLLALVLEGAWGSAIFGPFFATLPFVTAGVYTAVLAVDDASWAGPSAVIAALLGAYFVRSFGGFTIPGWLLVPIWVVGEHVFIRQVRLEDFDSTPMTLHAVSFGIGAAAALVIHFLGLEDKQQRELQDTEDLISNPVLEQALQARADGDFDGAFELLASALRRSPGDQDAATALWEVSRGSERARRAVSLLLGSIRDSLRHGRREAAATLWMSLTVEVPNLGAEPTLLVRMGEALLDEGHPEAAVHALALAVDGPKKLSAVLASRVVRTARDLDADLSQRAAAIALVDDQLDPTERAALEELLGDGAFGARPGSSPPQSARRPAPAPAAPPESAPPQPEEVDPYQDPHAIRADSLAETVAETGAETGADADSEAEPERWNLPEQVEDLSIGAEDETQLELSEAADSSESDNEVDKDFCGVAALSVDQLSEDAEATPAVSASADVVEVSETTETFDSSNLLQPVGVKDGLDDLLGGARRALRVRTATPIQLGASGLEVEVGGGVKMQIEFARIDALSAAAVRGLSAKPVIVIDIVLNWMMLPDEPLKVIRLRSDTFNPLDLVADAPTPLESIRMLLARILAASDATPLPSPSAARGQPFASFESLDAYHHTVLMVD